MQIVDRYISKNIIINVLIVLFVLLSLFAFFQYLEELKDVGKGRYDAGKAFMFVLMSLPTLIYQLLQSVAVTDRHNSDAGVIHETRSACGRPR